jgi:hypothetical protein
MAGIRVSFSHFDNGQASCDAQQSSLPWVGVERVGFTKHKATSPQISAEIKNSCNYLCYPMYRHGTDLNYEGQTQLYPPFIVCFYLFPY